MLANDSPKEKGGFCWPKKLKHLLELLTAFWLSSAAGHLAVDRFFPQQFKTMPLKQVSRLQRLRQPNEAQTISEGVSL